jgi:hypothetical protein
LPDCAMLNHAGFRAASKRGNRKRPVSAAAQAALR